MDRHYLARIEKEDEVDDFLIYLDIYLSLHLEYIDSEHSVIDVLEQYNDLPKMVVFEDDKYNDKYNPIVYWVSEDGVLYIYDWEVIKLCLENNDWNLSGEQEIDISNYIIKDWDKQIKRRIVDVINTIKKLDHFNSYMYEDLIKTLIEYLENKDEYGLVEKISSNITNIAKIENYLEQLSENE